MTPSTIRAIGLAVAVLYGGFLIWLYATQPTSLADVKGGMAAAVGLYEIDRKQFEEGRALFRADRFPEARAALARADPAQRDAVTQFYLAYSFYREGWGRLYNDDRLFAEALRALDRAVAHGDGRRVQVEDPNLGLPDSDALRAELQRGSKLAPEDFNPMRILRRRQ
jgi:hypothetical protein